MVIDSPSVTSPHRNAPTNTVYCHNPAPNIPLQSTLNQPHSLLPSSVYWYPQFFKRYLITNNKDNYYYSVHTTGSLGERYLFCRSLQKSKTSRWPGLWRISGWFHQPVLLSRARKAVTFTEWRGWFDEWGTWLFVSTHSLLLVELSCTVAYCVR